VEIAQAQRDVRTTYLGGFAGSLVSSAIFVFAFVGRSVARR
jgi:hypothetical protein